MIENIHLWKADRGTYFDRNVNIISWSEEYDITDTILNIKNITLIIS